MKEIDSVNKFKLVIKRWKLDLCSCKLRKVYLQNIKYLVVSKKEMTYMFRKIRMLSIYFS